MRRGGGARIPTSKQPELQSILLRPPPRLPNTDTGRKKRGREEKEKKNIQIGVISYLGKAFQCDRKVWAKSDPDCCVQRAYGAVVPRASHEKLIVLYNKLLVYLGKTTYLLYPYVLRPKYNFDTKKSGTLKTLFAMPAPLLPCKLLCKFTVPKKGERKE